MLMLFRAGLPILLVIGNMQKIMQNIIELPYSPQILKVLKKIILNTIKPLKKPSKVKVEKKVAKKEIKLSFLLPKKKPIISGFINSETAKISKFYNYSIIMKIIFFIYSP